MVRALATLLVVDLLLLAPVWIANGRIGPHLIAIEAIFVTGLFLALPDRRATRTGAWLAACIVVVVSVFWVGEAAARLSLARPLNLYLDLRLLGSVSDLLLGAVGPVGGTLLMLAGAAAAVGCLVALALLFGSLPSEGGRARTVGLTLVVLAVVLVPGRWIHARGAVFGLTSFDLVAEQSRQLSRMLGERARFADTLARTPSSYAGTPGLLTGLGGRDVVLAFIESYGVAALQDTRYRPIVLPRLEAMERLLAERGLHVATGRFVAPSQGGQSWLGHGSILSGLWLENQLRYDLLLTTDRATLVDDFEAAGYRSVAIMPAITMAWPEGERFGYDRIYAHADIDYRGPPLNWVTMPDQFTWSFLERTVRADGDGRPLFAELGLISSHAPWTPILPVLDDWETVGDGTVFERWADAGETPEELWRDTDRVREHYALAVGYAVDVLASYAANFVDERTLLIAMGDHQPAPLITGPRAQRSVPVHVVAADPDLVRPFLEWGFQEGALPSELVEPRRMDAFRAWFVHAFSGGDAS